MAAKQDKRERPYRVYTNIGTEWFTLEAAKARSRKGVTTLADVVNLEDDGTVLDRWAEVRLENVPVLVARK